MILPDRLRLPFAFDPPRLRGDLDRLSAEAWIAHFVTQNYEGDWSVLPLRSAAGARHPVAMIYSDPSATEYADTPLLARCPYFREAIARLGPGVQAVRLMRLTPGSRIREHRDHDLCAEDGLARIHIPVTSNPRVEFALNGRPVAMTPGSAWYLRLSDPHRVANEGSTDRVHMVADVAVNDWLRAMLERAADEQVPGWMEATPAAR